MVPTKTDRGVQRVVWRISQAHPQGEYVQVPAYRLKNTMPSETHERGFSISSLDLLRGTDVTETSMDTLPDEFIEAFARSMPAVDGASAEPSYAPNTQTHMPNDPRRDATGRAV